jgi:predicted membrane protein
MYKRGYIVIGAALIVLGLLALISSWIGVDLCALVLPLLVISAGVYILVRPRYAARGGAMHIQPLGNIKRTRAWTAVDEELWILIGDASFDLSQVTLPPSETVIRILGFVGDLRLVVPDTIPVAITSVAFLTSSRIFGAKRDTFLQPFETATEGYADAESRIRFESWRFVATVKVTRPRS